MTESPSRAFFSAKVFTKKVASKNTSYEARPDARKEPRLKCSDRMTPLHDTHQRGPLSYVSNLIVRPASIPRCQRIVHDV